MVETFRLTMAFATFSALWAASGHVSADHQCTDQHLENYLAAKRQLEVLQGTELVQNFSTLLGGTPPKSNEREKARLRSIMIDNEECAKVASNRLQRAHEQQLREAWKSVEQMQKRKPATTRDGIPVEPYPEVPRSGYGVTPGGHSYGNW